MFTASLVESIRQEFQLDWNGMHGMPHWMRVKDIGFRLCDINGADKQIIELFAILHDSQRRSEHLDVGHGARAADFAERLRSTHFCLSDEDFEKLATACIFHSDGSVSQDVTIGTCWDADRLDLLRYDEAPRPEFLSTGAAQTLVHSNWLHDLYSVRA